MHRGSAAACGELAFLALLGRPCEPPDVDPARTPLTAHSSSRLLKSRPICFNGRLPPAQTIGRPLDEVTAWLDDRELAAPRRDRPPAGARPPARPASRQRASVPELTRSADRRQGPARTGSSVVTAQMATS
jgi:hypothetical protein